LLNEQTSAIWPVIDADISDQCENCTHCFGDETACISLICVFTIYSSPLVPPLDQTSEFAQECILRCSRHTFTTGV